MHHMTTELRHAWDQHTDEPAAAYVRFLLYRNLGPCRTVDDAFAIFLRSAGAAKRSKTRAPSNWWKEHQKFDWADRATAWDIDTLETRGEETIAAIAQLMRTAATVAARALAQLTIKPKDYRSILRTIETLATYAPSEHAHRSEAPPAPKIAGASRAG